MSNSIASNFYAAANNTPLSLAYGKARFGTAKAIAASTIAQVGVSQWAQELCATLPKSAMAAYSADCIANARNGKLSTLCPISGMLSTTAFASDSSLHASIAKLRYPLVAISPLCYASLPTAAEASLPLHMLLARLIYACASMGIVRITTALPMQQAASTCKTRLIKILPMLQAIVGVSPERAARLPVLALSPSLCSGSTPHAFASALSVWAMRCYSMLYADYGTSLSDDDTQALAELDAMLNADERARQLAQKREDAAVRAARAAAARKITALSLQDAAKAVCATMQKVTCDWAHAVHGEKLMQLACPKPSVDAAWYSIINQLLIKFHPDSSLLSSEAYAAYTLMQQHLDMLVLGHNQALAELGLLPQETNELMRNVLARYNMADPCSKHEAKLQASASIIVHTERAQVKASQQQLAKALVQAHTVAQAQEQKHIPSHAADGRKLSIAERIALARKA